MMLKRARLILLASLSALCLAGCGNPAVPAAPATGQAPVAATNDTGTVPPLTTVTFLVKGMGKSLNLM